ncbi:vWA domain-containing protein [Nocardioides sp.]|uniref:vWA domain-containing protein n=1 Tax=Nocardioides sp. TaxID=35761 RepID=UPI00286D4FFF|nr:vWA domain-containing protein [Nocardioides sp.]
MNPLIDLPLVVIGTLALVAVTVVGGVWSRRSELGSWILRALMVVVLAAIALRPGLGTEPVPTSPAQVEVIVVIDRTTSMSALDWDGRQPRLDGVRRDLTDLVAALPTGRFTVLTFGRRVATELPSTQDDSLIEDTLALVGREQPFAGTGSRLDRPLETLSDLLDQVRERVPDRPRLVVLMSDGENTNRQAQASYDVLASSVDDGLVLGYGTVAGGRMPADEEQPGSGWIQDVRTGRDALSRLDEANLRSVAAELGLPYLHRTAPGSLDEVAAGWAERFRDSEPTPGGEVPVALELTWLLALALLLLVLVDLRSHWQRLLEARRALS